MLKTIFLHNGINLLFSGDDAAVKYPNEDHLPYLSYTWS